MTTIDNLLTKISDNGLEKFSNFINKKDLKVLKSLSTSVCLPSFITENQGKLLHKILYEYRLQLRDVESDIIEILENNLWSRPFRIIENIRKIFLTKNVDEESVIAVEFTHNTRIRDVLHHISTGEFGQIAKISNNRWHYALTEKNVVCLIESLKSYRFEVDQKITNFYEIIKKYEISDIKANYTFEEILPTNLKITLEKECGPLDLINETMRQDRSIRYQYFVKNPPKKYGNLSDLIVHRSSTKIWINSSLHDLTELVATLKSIDRLPILVVFDSNNSNDYVKNLQNFSDSMEKNGITDNIGIYFRLENTDTGKEFNNLIKDKQYNSPLTADTQVACVQTGKLPKFFLKDCDWAAKSVIVLGTSLRHSKTAIYSNRCDLIISHAEKESIIEAKANTWRS
jgi:hypothetical protein